MACARAAGKIAKHDRGVERPLDVAVGRTKSAAPASPPLPPLVETSTIVRRVSLLGEDARQLDQRGSARELAAEPAAGASRWATITIGARARRAGTLAR